MKKRTFRRLAAGIAACAMLAMAVPTVQLMPAHAADLISNGTFESGTSGWGTYKESGGACSLSTDGGRLALKVTSTGKLTYSVQMYYDIIPLYQNGVYRLKYDISSTQNRYVEGMIQQNGGTYQAYTWKGLSIGPNPTSVDYTFTMEAETDIMAKLVFNCGLEEVDGGALPEHTIYLDNVSLELVDDSAVDYGANRPYEASILTSQLGYIPDARKTAVVRGNADSFSVINKATGQAVITNRALSSAVTNSSANETDRIADFSDLTANGTYVIRCSGLDDSYPFTIDEGVYDDMMDEAVHMFYLQRCGCGVQDATFGHAACHTGTAVVYGTGQTIDASGGWHDAGDYGRYTVAGAKAVADLLYAYLANPERYGDSTGIPESGNGKADILDEVKYELDWMFKMQASDGGAYHKVTCESFPGYVMPQNETGQLIVTPVSTTATADFAAAMALAAEVYKDYDASYAQKCLTAAEKAWQFLEQNPNLIFQNPSDITTGEYGDKSDKDERYWAAAQLYRTTGDSKYLNALNSLGTQDGLDWALVGDYGNIAILTMNNPDSTVYDKAKSSVLSQAAKLATLSENSPYGVALSKYNWGSNMTVANAGIILYLAHALDGSSRYLDAAQAQLDYLLGENPLGECFVTGFGTVSPENPHHRPSMAQNQAQKGMLVGGVNQNLEDSAAKAYCANEPAAKCYVDNSESYSTNEITIYWNSPLVYLVTVLDNPTEVMQPTEEPTQAPTEAPTGGGTLAVTLWGDADVDGDCDIIDVISVNKDQLGSFTLTAQGVKNADVDQNGIMAFSDAVNIMKSLVDLVPLPVGEPVESPTQAPIYEAPTEAPTEAPLQGAKMTASGYMDYGTEMNAGATKVADFRGGESPLFFASDGWTNGSCFDCGWYKQNTSLAGSCLSLTIDQDHSGKYSYSGAEYRTTDFYGYGYYETSMQAIKNVGVVSSFFTYTGPSDNNPWDEIDIEILGKDTTRVQFNYYTSSQGNHEYMYDLGFDASEGFHTYGFDWQPGRITWYVDGAAVYSATDNIPTTPGKIMMNTWPGTGVDEWLGHYNGNTPLTARYQWVTYNQH